MLILSATQVEVGWITGAIRSILWMIAKGCLLLLDGMFSVIDQVWRFEFFKNEYVNTLFSGAIIFACSWIVLKVMIEFLINHILKSTEDQNPLAVFKGVVIAIAVMFLITPVFNLGHQFSTNLTDAVIKTTNNQNGIESKISGAVIEAMANDSNMESSDKDTFVDNWKTVDYNDTYDNGLFEKDLYKYDFNLFMLIVISILILFIMIFIGVQMAKRVVELALYKIIGPVVATSLTNSKSRAFQTWTKGIIALLLVTAIQFICLGLLINVFSSTIDETSNIMTSILLLVGSLLFVVTSPNIVSNLLGENIGAMSAFNDIQTTVMMGAGAGMGINIAKGGLTSALAKGSSVMNVVPKTGGALKGMAEQYKSMRSSGSTKLGAIAKVGANQTLSPIKNIMSSNASKFNDIYNQSRNNTLSRNLDKNINPIAFVERKSDKYGVSYPEKHKSQKRDI